MPTAPKCEYTIDGDAFDDLDGFFEEVGKTLVPGVEWGHNLDAFNDILNGGFGTPTEGFRLIWQNSARSRQALGYPETVRRLGHRLETCHPESRDQVRNDIELAERGEGQTVFEWLIEIIRSHADVELARVGRHGGGRHGVRHQEAPTAVSRCWAIWSPTGAAAAVRMSRFPA